MLKLPPPESVLFSASSHLYGFTRTLLSRILLFVLPNTFNVVSSLQTSSQIQMSSIVRVRPLLDLAFPQPCDIPPEVLVPLGCSVPSSDAFFPVGDFRSRSRSEVPQPTVSAGYSNRASGGVLVMFPPNNSSASSSTNSSTAALHNNNYVVPPGKCHRRHASVCCDGGACPADHPLYVDTQLANNNQTNFDKKRSPVAHMVDFVKGRSRTNSMMCSGAADCPRADRRKRADLRGPVSPVCRLESSTSPLCFTVDGAPMANNSPIRSPAIRPRTATTGSRYTRSVVLQGMHSQRSLDESGSPVALGHTALLVREAVPSLAFPCFPLACKSHKESPVEWTQPIRAGRRSAGPPVNSSRRFLLLDESDLNNLLSQERRGSRELGTSGVRDFVFSAGQRSHGVSNEGGLHGAEAPRGHASEEHARRI
ncbi:hypothetical protein L596_024166 [Steinernema carpocapsae]|uniref:Uncharacterized protein n=1 Tax=Steinernema carpocapsae TaxID=34508 RepID=A0A4U5MGM7_STECR|nr:hypothetical protein L596_024166 [Steinernema carpocapsae]